MKRYIIVFLLFFTFINLFSIFQFEQNITVEDYLVNVFQKNSNLIVCSDNGVFVYEIEDDENTLLHMYSSFIGDEYFLNENNFYIRNGRELKQYDISDINDFVYTRTFRIPSTDTFHTVSIKDNIVATAKSGDLSNGERINYVSVYEVGAGNYLYPKLNANFTTTNSAAPKIRIDENNLLFYTIQNGDLDLVFDCNNLDNIVLLEENINNSIYLTEDLLILDNTDSIDLHFLEEDGYSYNTNPDFQISKTYINNNLVPQLVQSYNETLFTVYMNEDQYLIRCFSLEDFSFLGEYSVLNNEISLFRGILIINESMVLTDRTAITLTSMNQDNLDNTLWVAETSSHNSYFDNNKLFNIHNRTISVIDGNNGETINSFELEPEISYDENQILIDDDYIISRNMETLDYHIYENSSTDVPSLLHVFGLQTNLNRPMKVFDDVVHFAGLNFHAASISDQTVTYVSSIETKNFVYQGDRVYIQGEYMGRNRLCILNIENPAQPIFLGSLRIDDEKLIDINGNFAYTYFQKYYAGEYTGYLRVYDITDPESITNVSESDFSIFSEFDKGIYADNHIILSHPQANLLTIFDVSDNYQAMYKGTFRWNHTIKNLHGDSEKIIVPSYYGISSFSLQETDTDPEINHVNNFSLTSYPNPFSIANSRNLGTTIKFNLQKQSNVNLSVFNVRGQKIKSLTDNNLNKGEHQVKWDGRDSSNNLVSTGVYFYKLEIDQKTSSIIKCLILK